MKTNSPNGVFVVGLMFASFAVALVSGQFKPSWLAWACNSFYRWRADGVGRMTALGCTVGVLLSGIHAGALSGWIFLLCCGLGVEREEVSEIAFATFGFYPVL
ncbi:YeeE/YedE thiosulfate transporter family protein [Agrobacterium tumefaciens]|uniref:YeeE/YedE thiosulfate transporter family protein n=1 Tax=Agrobacterium tumefaciens TaxID=358 RepID=UPI00287E11C9|nr:YeeE/YedE thiosulfate transporter family protein [Agrobacterium tumefaciens]MDS7594688.1 YeeE/YedE family protein [Agrobacterium tumefaciens]